MDQEMLDTKACNVWTRSTLLAVYNISKYHKALVYKSETEELTN